MLRLITAVYIILLGSALSYANDNGDNSNEVLVKVLPIVKNTLSEMIKDSMSTHFYSGLQVLYFNMTYENNNTLLQKHLTDIYWKRIEENTFSGQLTEYLLNYKWNIYKDLSDLNILPVIEYPNVRKYPKRIENNNVDSFLFTEFQIVTDQDHILFLQPHRKVI